MSLRTFWTIVLKIFGLYILVQILYFVPTFFSEIVVLFSAGGQYGGRGEAWIALSALLLTFSVFLFMLIAFLFRPDRLIDVLSLERLFHEDEIEFKMHRSSILYIAVIVTGLVMFIDSLPLFLKELYGYYKQINELRGFKDYPGATWIIFSLVKVFISFFMITSPRLIVNFIERKRRGKTKIAEAE